MHTYNRKKGSVGEELAKEHLRKIGHLILDSNFRIKGAEIDIISTFRGALIFTEVKLKVGDEYGLPEEMINQLKIQRIQKAAQLFLMKNPEIDKKYPAYQIDAICITLNNDGSVKSLNHYESI